MGARNYTAAMPYSDGLAEAVDNGCGTFADTELKIKSIGAEAAPIKPYVGVKPGNLLHGVLGGPYGAGLLAANVPSLCSDAEADCDGKMYYTLPY